MKEFEKWFKKAEEDLFVIKHILKLENAPADICCFHAQQAIEKYLKAYLISKNVLFPKTHDLQLLVQLCIQINPIFNDILPQALSLINYAVVPRYPDMLDDLTIEDAKLAYQNALFIKEFILKYFFH
jgi:HEPN domain-containing protein